MLVRILAAAQRVGRDDKGATAIEYALIATLVSVVIITGVTLLGGNLTATFDAIGTGLG